MSHTNNQLQESEPHKCKVPCSPSDYCKGGKCDRMGCYEESPKKVHEIKLNIHRQADLMTRTRVNKIKELFEKDGHKVTIVTR